MMIIMDKAKAMVTETQHISFLNSDPGLSAW